MPRERNRRPLTVRRTQRGIITSEAIDKTLADIERTGHIPDDHVIEQRFPGITGFPSAKKEMMMMLIFNLRLRGFKNWQIANSMGMTPGGVSYYNKEIKKNFEREISEMSFMGQLGRSIAVFRELQAQCFKTINSEDKALGHKERLMAIRVAGVLEHSVISTLAKAGFFNANRLTPKRTKTGNKSDVEMIQQQILIALRGEPDMEAFIEGEAEEIETVDDDFEDDDISVLRY